MKTTEFNPLIEAIGGIDDNIVSDAMSKTTKRPRAVRTVLLAAAVAVFCTGSVTTMAVASLKAPKDVLINDVSVVPQYSTYTTENGTVLEVYVTDIPEYALDEEVEGYTAVGDVKVVQNPEYPRKWGKWMLVDEAGNVFHVGINNKVVKAVDKGTNHYISFDVMNFSDDYEWLEVGTDSLSYFFVPSGQGDEFLLKHGYKTYWF